MPSLTVVAMEYFRSSAKNSPWLKLVSATVSDSRVSTGHVVEIEHAGHRHFPSVLFDPKLRCIFFREATICFSHLFRDLGCYFNLRPLPCPVPFSMRQLARSRLAPLLWLLVFLDNAAYPYSESRYDQSERANSDPCKC